MKRIIGLVLVCCLVFSVAAGAFAGSRPKITKQPESATTDKKGTVTFSIKTSGTVEVISWHFVSPDGSTDVTGKKLSAAVEGVKVKDNKTNGKSITLKNVPESMHGWAVYAHVNGNGYKLDSERAYIYVYGLDRPDGAPAEDTAADEGQEAGEEAPAEDAAPAEEEPAPEEPAAEEPAVEEPTAEEPAAEEPAAEEPAQEEPAAEAPAEAEPAADAAEEAEPENTVFTITATSKVLRLLDDAGNPVDDTLSSSLEFTGIASVLVTSQDPIVSWTLNGIRIQPASPVNEFTVMNITSDLSMDIKTERTSAADAQVDEDHMCKVTCRGCSFTYIRGKLFSVTEGEVPAGAPINIAADSSELAQNGYRVNGGEPENEGKAGFQLTVTDDVEIVCE